jgi:preprotein translocase subunit SecG
MYTLLLIIFLFTCISLTIVILLQSSKGGGLAGAFGGGGDMGAVFGGRGAASFMSKATGWLAAFFLLISLLLAKVNDQSAQGARSIVKEAQEERGTSVPAARLPIVAPDDETLLPVENTAPSTSDSSSN